MPLELKCNLICELWINEFCLFSYSLFRCGPVLFHNVLHQSADSLCLGSNVFALLWSRPSILCAADQSYWDSTSVFR